MTQGLGRVLVVDDDEVIRQLIAVNLTLEGFDVVTAVDGQDCLDKVLAIAPDVITLDVMMPRLDGWETAVQLRKTPQTAHIKVVMITARAQEDDIARGAHVGADAYLTKPFDPGEMIRVVRELAGVPPALCVFRIFVCVPHPIQGQIGHENGHGAYKGNRSGQCGDRRPRSGMPRPPPRAQHAQHGSDSAAAPGPGRMITADLRRAIARAAEEAGVRAGAGPGLRPGGGPGQYVSSAAFGLGDGRPPREAARLLADHLAQEPWIARAEVSGPGFLALTVSTEALAALPARIAAAGAAPACARSDALRGVTLEAPPPACLRAAPGWEEARKALAAELTARLAAAAGATVTAPRHPERSVPSPQRGLASGTGEGAPPSADVVAAIAFAGPDAVRFSLARAMPGRPVRIDAAVIARRVPDNPAYAVRYAHARAASGVRWAATRPAAAVPRRPPADPGELALLDALSWLPERVAVAASRGRPDEFARYLEELAGATIGTLSSPRQPGSAGPPGSDRLVLAGAAQAGLAAGLGLLGVSAPDRM